MPERSGLCLPASRTGLSDGAIAVRAQRGNRAAMDYLLAKYRPVVEGKAREYFWSGAEAEDVVQEGMIGLYKAVHDYVDTAPASFRAFAELCIHRQIITALKAATRRKHMLLNSCVSTTQPVGSEEGWGGLGEVLADSRAGNPERVVLSRELWNRLRQLALGRLSQLEWQVLLSHALGAPYQDIAAELGCNAKQIDNALQRAKKKIVGQLAADISN